WRLMTPPQHLWYFTRASIERFARPLGLRMESFDHPWKIVPVSLITFQLRRMLGLRPAGTPAASRVGVPVNLFDAMRLVLGKGERVAYAAPRPGFSGDDSRAADMNDRLSLVQIALLVSYAGGMVGGQLLFKLAALRGSIEGPFGERLLAMMANGYFVAAVVL